MLPFYERDVDFLEMRLSSVPSNKPVSFDFFLHVLPELVNGAKEKVAIYRFKNKTASVHLEQVNVDVERGVCTLLFHYTDKNISDPAFKSMVTGNVRKAKKNPEKEEGVAVSAHMVICLDRALKQNAPCYLALLEVVPGLTKGLIERAMTSFFNNVFPKKWTHPDNNKLQVRPSFELDHLTSNSLIEGLHGRRLTALTFISKSLDDDMDEDELSIKEKRVSFAVGENLREEASAKLLFKSSEKALKQGYTVLKVNYEDIYGSKKSGTFKSIEPDALAKATGVFSKRATVHAEEMLDQCNEEIRSDLSGKMVALLIKEGGLKDDIGNSQEAPEAAQILANQS